MKYEIKVQPGAVLKVSEPVGIGTPCAWIPCPTKPGTYQVEFKRERAPLPKGYDWDGNTIVCKGEFTDYRWSVSSWEKGTKYPSVAVRERGGFAVPSIVIDAFRAEGLL